MNNRTMIWIAIQIVFLLGLIGGAVMISIMTPSSSEPVNENAKKPNEDSFFECFAIPGPFARACAAEKLIDQVTEKGNKSQPH